MKVSDFMFGHSFDDFSAIITLAPYNIELMPSSLRSYNQSPDLNPIPVIYRGMYFPANGVGYFIIDGCQSNPLILPHNLTI